MSLPTNITREHLLSAIDKIDKEGIPSYGDSQYYDVIFNGRTYPPKLIVSYANIEANGFELDRKSFNGGRNTECFSLLKEKGFEIKEKNTKAYSSPFSSTVLNFLKQAHTTDLKSSHYPNSFKGLEVKVSFGKGNQARIPWVALLREGQAVSNGIYPVFLYYKDQKLLILTYGLSETQESCYSWNLKPPTQTIEELFVAKFNSKPARYGNSFVHSYYFIDTNAPSFGLSPSSVDQDLAAVIEIYKNLSLDQSNKKHEHLSKNNYEISNKQKSFDYNEFYIHSKEAGLIFSEKLVTRFISALCTKPFVILTGLAGSGKTKLAQGFSQWISADESQVCIVPVGADWTNREPLLGFPNALDTTKYAAPESGTLQLLIRASENLEKPYFLILDEMNLSHVERYFADFLSAMESHEAIPLHAEEGIKDIPSHIHLPENVFIIGTVNIDETTYMFSPKVLDRANAIEFRVTPQEMEAFLTNTAKLDLAGLKHRGADMATDFVNKAQSDGIFNTDTLNSALLSFFGELKNVGAEFGYRTASEIKRFAGVVHTLNVGWSIDETVDAVVMQKLLPKIHGSRRKIEPSLKALASLCLVKKEDVTHLLNNSESVDYEDAAKVKYPISLEKILRMHKAVVQDGFTSFAEA